MLRTDVVSVLNIGREPFAAQMDENGKERKGYTDGTRSVLTQVLSMTLEYFAIDYNANYHCRK